MPDYTQTGLFDPLRDFWEQVQVFLPHLLLALLIIVAGSLLGWVIKEVVTRGLRLLKFDRLATRLGITLAIEQVGGYRSPSAAAGYVSGWVVILVALIVALNALDTQITRDLVFRVVGYLPHLLVAGLILLVGAIVSRFLARAVLLAAVNARVRAASILAGLVRFLVMALAAVAALEHLGIGRATVLVAFGIIFGGVVLALSIAFGLGGRDLARELLEGQLRRRDQEGEDDSGLRHL